LTSLPTNQLINHLSIYLSIYLVEEHQQWQQQILDAEMAIDGCDRAAERLVRTLHQAKMTLEDAVDEAEDQIAETATRGKYCLVITIAVADSDHFE
jgi:hypothetical protein